MSVQVVVELFLMKMMIRPSAVRGGELPFGVTDNDTDDDDADYHPACTMTQIFVPPFEGSSCHGHVGCY